MHLQPRNASRRYTGQGHVIDPLRMRTVTILLNMMTISCRWSVGQMIDNVVDRLG